MTTFVDWIMRARTTDDPVGNLIEDTRLIIKIAGRPPPITSVQQLRSYLRLRGACSECLDTVPLAWRRYRKWFAVMKCTAQQTALRNSQGQDAGQDLTEQTQPV